ncbi:conserved hypothetical protein [Ricinus communis]|uniref:Uncharacterized protein n=1 Tax=Ricinus communis TaxID=3988 RepID=B9SR66_RICCO|nr:conserved hypothetical protein [Ricinus communis]
MVTRPSEQDQLRYMTQGTHACIKEKLTPILRQNFEDFKEYALNIEELEQKKGSFKRNTTDNSRTKEVNVSYWGKPYSSTTEILSISNTSLTAPQPRPRVAQMGDTMLLHFAIITGWQGIILIITKV